MKNPLGGAATQCVEEPMTTFRRHRDQIGIDDIDFRQDGLDDRTVNEFDGERATGGPNDHWLDFADMNDFPSHMERLHQAFQAIERTSGFWL